MPRRVLGRRHLRRLSVPAGAAHEPLRLLVLTDASGFGGAEQCVGYLLAELDPAARVAVAGIDRDVVDRIAAHRPQTGTAVVGSSGARAFGAVIRGWRPTVVHLNRSHLYAGMGATRAAIACPGVAAVAVEHLPWGGEAGRRTLWQLRALDRLLDAHVAVGARAARLVERSVGYRPDSVIAVPNGVPPFSGTALPRPVPGAIIGSLGRVTAQKGYDRLVRLLPDLPGTTLVLVGDGPERAAIEQLAAELDVGERLLVTGWTQDARRWLTTLDVFVMPSRWEGLPLSILEAMHAALPVVASDVGSVADAVTDGETGFVVAPDDDAALVDRLRRLVADAPLRRQFGDRGRARAARDFTAVVMARRYEAVYLAAAAGHPSSHGLDLMAR